ncbi:hypothetical protein ACFVRV_06205 [Arthrobacter koreensis]|uniref:hypothetical protein n=1 Tax=Arthrobacter koreensis TaxID=199136 RepID=UPI0036D96254
MTSYGFKLLLTHLHVGQGHKKQDFGATGYLNLVVQDVTAAMDRRKAALAQTAEAAEHSPTADDAERSATSVDDADLSAREDVVSSARDGEEDDSTSKPKRDSVVRLEKVVRLKSGVLLHTQYGVVGDHHLAVDPEAKKTDTDLRNLATTRLYRAVLIAPQSGDNAFLAVEVISRSNAGAQLPRRLHQAAVGHKYKLRTRGPVVDKPSLDDLMKNGGVQEVELYKTSFAADGAHPEPPEQVTVNIKLGASATKNARLLERIKTWPLFARKDSAEDGTTPVSASDEADAVAGILWEDFAELGWDDTKVRVKSPSQKRALQPLDHKEGFIYDIGETVLSDDEFLEKVNDSARLLFATYGMAVDDDWYQELPTSDLVDQG